MRTKGRINACNLIQKIGSRRGSSSIMIFFSFTVAALMMSMVILQYSHVYLATEHTQMLADVTADGITVGADSGWGLMAAVRTAAAFYLPGKEVQSRLPLD